MAFLQEQLSIFFPDYIESQTNRLKENKLKLHSYQFRKYTFLNDSISVNTKGPLKTASKGSQITVTFNNNFGNYLFNVATQKQVAQCAVKLLNQHWISKFGPPKNLITDRGTEFLITEGAKRCTLFNFTLSQKRHMMPGKWI